MVGNGKKWRQDLLATGTFERALDGKLRVLLPKFVRQATLGDGQLFATPGTDKCLELHNSGSIQALAELAMKSGGRNATAKTFGRLFYSQAESLEIDKQGRIRIPGRLAEWAELETQVALVGVGSHWEIWDLGRWQSYFENQQIDFDQVHQSTFDAGVFSPPMLQPTSSEIVRTRPDVAATRSADRTSEIVNPFGDLVNNKPK